MHNAEQTFIYLHDGYESLPLVSGWVYTSGVVGTGVQDDNTALGSILYQGGGVQ